MVVVPGFETIEHTVKSKLRHDRAVSLASRLSEKEDEFDPNKIVSFLIVPMERS